mmetsp:Transcript_10671/g.46207  ORF Transcript_10671/g.46207 Transcript_10671/m.46207 type:complete len:251 (+) Transcript_10671:272-1024(+)
MNRRRRRRRRITNTRTPAAATLGDGRLRPVEVSHSDQSPARKTRRPGSNFRSETKRSTRRWIRKSLTCAKLCDVASSRRSRGGPSRPAAWAYTSNAATSGESSRKRRRSSSRSGSARSRKSSTAPRARSTSRLNPRAAVRTFVIVFRRLEIRAIDSRSSAAWTRMTKPPSVWPISCRPWTRWRRLRTSSRRRRGAIEGRRRRSRRRCVMTVTSPRRRRQRLRSPRRRTMTRLGSCRSAWMKTPRSPRRFV